MVDVVSFLAANWWWLLLVVLLLLGFLISGFHLIGENQVGIVTRKMLGRPMPQGQVIARKGQVGVLADTLVPGLYWRIPLVYRVESSPVIEVPADQVAIVEAIDGRPLPPGRLLGDEVESNQFQDTERFLANGGFKGPQVAILRPGKYRINNRMFRPALSGATTILPGAIGVVIAQDGVPLPSNFVVAPPAESQHNFFQNGEAFLVGRGYRGPQLDTLQPGRYYINPLLFSVSSTPNFEVPPGSVAVIRSNVGEELERVPDTPTAVGDAKTSLTEEVIHPEKETLLPLTSTKLRRGIYRSPLAPGTYNLNPIAYTAFRVPTSAVMIDWADSRPQDPTNRVDFQFGALGVTTKDGFTIPVEVRLVIRIEASNAAFIIARFGSVDNLISQIVHPVIDAEFRNNAGLKKALEFVQSRPDLQKEALGKAKDAFAAYNVEAQNLLISQIRMPPELMATQTAKEIALQQQAQYQEQAQAEKIRITVQEQTAMANLKPKLVEAEYQIAINTSLADAAAAQADGDKRATIARAEGTKSKFELEGQGQATAIQATGLATAAAYRAQNDALGRESVAAIQVIKEIADGKVGIVPQTLITSGGGDANGGLLTAWLVRMLQEGSNSNGGSAATPPKGGAGTPATPTN